MKIQFSNRTIGRDALLLAAIWYLLVPNTAEAYVGITAGACMMQVMLATGLTGVVGFRTILKFLPILKIWKTSK